MMNYGWLKAPSPWGKTPLIDDDANTVAHVYWRRGALLDTKSNAWAMTGNVGQMAGAGKIPPGAGPFTASAYYTLATGVASSSMTVVAVFRPGSASLGFYPGLLTGGSASGFLLGGGSDGSRLRFIGSGASSGSTANQIVSGTVNVAAGGSDGTNLYVQLNGGTVASAAGVSASATPVYLGTTNDLANNYCTAEIIEVWVSSSAWSASSVAALLAKIKARVGDTAW